MIHLDTNVLIALTWLARHRHSLALRIRRGEPVATSSLACFEYLGGPVEDVEQQLVHDFAPFTEHGLTQLAL